MWAHARNRAQELPHPPTMDDVVLLVLHAQEAELHDLRATRMSYSSGEYRRAGRRPPLVVTTASE